MAFQAPNIGQERQNRRILEELQEQKRRLQGGTSASAPPSIGVPQSLPSPPVISPNVGVGTGFSGSGLPGGPISHMPIITGVPPPLPPSMGGTPILTPPLSLPTTVLSSGLPPTSSSSVGGLNKMDLGPDHQITTQERKALQHAHANSVGYFITQDSAFGNLIIPVIPRLPEPPSASSAPPAMTEKMTT